MIQFTASSYVGGVWVKCVLAAQEKDGFYEGITADQARLAVRVEQIEQPSERARTVYRVQVGISANERGCFSGVKLHMPVKRSLECVWKPHLAPEEELTIGDKAFRSPAMIFEDGQQRMALIPDLNSAGLRHVPHIMDYVLTDHELYYGLSDYEETGHVYYRLTPRERKLEEELRYSFYLVYWEKGVTERKRDFRTVEAFLWDYFAAATMVLRQSPEEWVNSLSHYPRYAYEWALDRWQEVCWQQFELEGRQVGGVVFITTAKQKPGMGMEEQWREPKSLWNQAWFCSLRSAYGYWQAGHAYDRPDWVKKAELNLEFALSAPQTNGLFPGYFQAGDDNDWATGRWFMSGPRRPEHHEHYVHLLDSSWTCYWLLKWYKDINKDERIIPYVSAYVNRLLALQRQDGGFPAWVDPQTLESSPYLAVSPEAAVHAMLLCLWHELDPSRGVIGNAEKVCSYIIQHIVASGRWEDFETYWSCSKQWPGKQYGVKDRRSGLYNQCNFGMYWTAEALRMLYLSTGNKHWLDAGEALLAEISLFQQIWEPDFLPVPTLGGFGVMTSDDEWNDARQSLFALMYYDYYKITKNHTYLARSMWAMKASFYMMYCPENEQVKALYERVHPHFDQRDYGFHMENFNHHDGTAVEGLGEFTIFDWGCGAASSAYFELRSKLEI